MPRLEMSIVCSFLREAAETHVSENTDNTFMKKTKLVEKTSEM